MTVFYTTREYEFLKREAEATGAIFDLVLCSDGVMRIPIEAQKFEQHQADLIRAGVAFRPEK